MFSKDSLILRLIHSFQLFTLDLTVMEALWALAVLQFLLKSVPLIPNLRNALLEKSCKFCGLRNADTLILPSQSHTAPSHNEDSNEPCSKEIM